jgi:hypothetical protein
MIPIPIVWTEYTATLQGRILKFVPCENCGTEYVYVLAREGMGCGKSFYLLNEDAAKEQAKTGAEEALQSYLENDFDPIPCPACGHYQRFMFPKLYDGGSTWLQLAQLIAIVVGCVDGVAVLYWTFAYLQHPGDHALGRLGVALALLPVVGLIVLALNRAERARARRFDPNTEDLQARLAKGRSRAITRAEFEAVRERSAGTADRRAVAEPGTAPSADQDRAT